LWWERGILWFDQFVSPEIAYKLNKYGMWSGFFSCCLFYWWLFQQHDNYFGVFLLVGAISLVIGLVGIQGFEGFYFGVWKYDDKGVAVNGCGCTTNKLLPFGHVGWIRNRLAALYFCLIGRAISYFCRGWFFTAVMVSLLGFIATKLDLIKI
jgi:hypothetical protein